MLDHVSLRVADYERSKKFYVAVLAPLGFTLAMESASSGAGFRRDGIPAFWVKLLSAARDGDEEALHRIHIQGIQLMGRDLLPLLDGRFV